MSWLSARLAVALFAIPVAACSGSQTSAKPEPPPGPSVSSTWQWCGSSAEAWQQSRQKPSKAECPDEIRRDFEDWQVNADRGELHKQQKQPQICCYDRGPRVVEPPPPDAGPPDARPRIRYRPPIKGRPLVIGESFARASAIDDSAWPTPTGTWRGAGLEAEVRAEIARRWLDAALAEHASIASFARCALELLAAGAPPQLIAAAQRASIDEIEHAQLCFGVASSYAGHSLGAGPLPAAAPRTLDLIGLAVTTFEEGCVCETIAALEAAAILPAVTDPELRRILEQIRDDEARHAELAWATVGWAARTGGALVVDAVREAARALRPSDRTAPGNVIDAQLAEHGVMSERQRRALELDAWDATIEPLLCRLSDTCDAPEHAPPRVGPSRVDHQARS